MNFWLDVLFSAITDTLVGILSDLFRLLLGITGA